MTRRQTDARAQAEALMKKRRFPEAIALFDEHLQGRPDDLIALLEMGICHLLNTSEDAFLAIHRRAADLIAALRNLPGDVSLLWSQYNALVKKVAATALVLGSVAAGGCENGASSSHKYSGGVYKNTQLTQEVAQNEAQPTTRPQGKSVKAGKDTQGARPNVSAHRYSGGVAMPKRPESRPRD